MVITETNKIDNLILNIITKGLGVLWLCDGLLQLQSKMFTSDFITSVLLPNLQNQPKLIHSLVSIGISAFSFHPALANAGAAILQLALGILLLFPFNSKATHFGLYLSIFWGIGIWIFGEGLGGLFTGTSSFYTGAPGSALVYAFCAILLLMPNKINVRLYPALASLLIMGAITLQLQASFWQQDGLQILTQASANDQVQIINTIPAAVNNLLLRNPPLNNYVFLILLPLLLSFFLILKSNWLTGGCMVIFLLLVWWLTQDFGNITTIFFGTSTDLNTAPVLLLLILPAFFSDQSFTLSSEPTPNPVLPV